MLKEVLRMFRPHQQIQEPFLTLRRHGNICTHVALQALGCHSAAAYHTRPLVETREFYGSSVVSNISGAF